MTPSQQKAAIAAGVAVLGTAVLKRSRLARLAVVSGVAAAVYGKLGVCQPEWHPVERPVE